MRSFSFVSVLLVGAVLTQADVHRRRYVNDRDSENQIDSTGTPVEEPELAERRNHRHHSGHHHHLGRPHHRGFHHRSRVNLSQAEETMEFRRYFIRNVRILANESGLCNDDINTLINIIEENRPAFKREDRSEWTEEQWQKSKEECDKRKQLVRLQAYEQIHDQVHLAIFFDKLEAQKKQMKENIHKFIVRRLTRIAVRSGLNDTQIEKFMRELESHKPVGVHWRPGMSQNEKKKNILIHVRNWMAIKAACLRDAGEAEQLQLNDFFAAVERDFTSGTHGEHYGPRHHHRRHLNHHRQHHHYEDVLRGPRRQHRDRDYEYVDSEAPRHRHHRHHHVEDDNSEETPRRNHHRQHRHEIEDGEQTPMRRRHLPGNDEADDSEEPHRHHHRRHHHHHRHPHHVDDSSDGEDREREAPVHHHRRNYHHRQHRHQEEDNSGERNDEEFEPLRRNHHYHHRHHNRHEDSAEDGDTKVRPEPYRQYRRHVRRGDSVEE